MTMVYKSTRTCMHVPAWTARWAGCAVRGVACLCQEVESRTTRESRLQFRSDATQDEDIARPGSTRCYPARRGDSQHYNKSVNIMAEDTLVIGRAYA